VIAKFDPEWGAGLWGDKSHSMVFDNSKIKRTVPGFSATIPFRKGREIMAWLDANPSWKTVDETLNATIDSIIARYEAVA